MAKFIVEFDIDNAAFEDACTEECARILRTLANTLENQIPVGAMEHNGEKIRIMDINGNGIGWARVH